MFMIDWRRNKQFFDVTVKWQFDVPKWSLSPNCLLKVYFIHYSTLASAWKDFARFLDTMRMGEFWRKKIEEEFVSFFRPWMLTIDLEALSCVSKPLKMFKWSELSASRTRWGRAVRFWRSKNKWIKKTNLGVYFICSQYKMTTLLNYFQ